MKVQGWLSILLGIGLVACAFFLSHELGDPTMTRVIAVCTVLCGGFALALAGTRLLGAAKELDDFGNGSHDLGVRLMAAETAQKALTRFVRIFVGQVAVDEGLYRVKNRMLERMEAQASFHRDISATKVLGAGDAAPKDVVTYGHKAVVALAAEEAGFHRMSLAAMEGLREARGVAEDTRRLTGATWTVPEFASLLGTDKE